MITLVRSFSAKIDHFTESLGNSIANNFSVKIDTLEDSLGGNKIAGAFSVKIDQLVDSFGGHQIATSFSLPKGGYEVDGVTLESELEEIKIVRKK